MTVARKVDGTAAQANAVVAYRQRAALLRDEAIAHDASLRPLNAAKARHGAAIASRAAYAELHPQEGA